MTHDDDKPDTDQPGAEPGGATPEGYTHEDPAPSEIGDVGTPGAGLSASAPHAADVSDDDHGHEGPALGPIDWGKWAYAIVGGVGGLIVIAFFWFALGGLPS